MGPRLSKRFLVQARRLALRSHLGRLFQGRRPARPNDPAPRYPQNRSGLKPGFLKVLCQGLRVQYETIWTNERLKARPLCTVDLRSQAII